MSEPIPGEDSSPGTYFLILVPKKPNDLQLLDTSVKGVSPWKEIKK